MSPAGNVKYAWPVRAIHWVGAALILLAYLTSELSEDIEEGASAGVDWHVFAGLALLLLFVPRLLAKLAASPQPIVPQPPRWSLLPGRLVTLALLLFVVVQPILGILTVWSEGHALQIPLTSWSLPPMIVLGGEAEDILEDAHETLGNVFYAVIAAHALAALWHHFIRRDTTLRRML
jgi:superoxide oxidase